MLLTKVRRTVPYRRFDPSSVRYGTVPVYRAVHQGVPNNFILFSYCSTVAVSGDPHTGNLSDRYVPPGTDGTLRYDRPCY